MSLPLGEVEAVCAFVFVFVVCAQRCVGKRKKNVRCPLVQTREKSVFQHRDNSSGLQSCFWCGV